MKRRDFLKTTAMAGAATMPLGEAAAASGPIILSTWDFKLPVNETAAGVLSKGGTLLDAVEKSIGVVEDDPNTTSVGRGGFPDRNGQLTLDACIMDHKGNAGSVVFLEHIGHPISVARLVMEKTPHVILAGEGALQFALEQGFKKEELLTERAKKAYADWLKASRYSPAISRDNHDTVGLLAMDGNGDLSGGCSTSGAAWKMRGRVGDSPIIGAGLYVDNEIGAATSTGLGEAVIKIAGSFLVVELMRGGKSPQQACELAVRRVFAKQPKYKDTEGFMVAFIALSKRGEIGAFASGKGFQYSLYKDGRNTIADSDFLR